MLSLYDCQTLASLLPLDKNKNCCLSLDLPLPSQRITLDHVWAVKVTYLTYFMDTFRGDVSTLRAHELVLKHYLTENPSAVESRIPGGTPSGDFEVGVRLAPRCSHRISRSRPRPQSHAMSWP